MIRLLKQPAAVVALAVFLTAGCSSAINRATTGLMAGLDHAMLNQDDPAIVRDGAPSFLLMIDAQIGQDKNNADLLMAGAKLYGAYANAFVSDPIRARRLTDKAFSYSLRALCIRKAELCKVYQQPYSDFIALAQETTVQDVPVLYGFAAAWAGQVQTDTANWAALADIPKIKALMERVIELDETYDNGGAHLYLGVIASQLPEALGGRPEQGKLHFARAITLSKGHNLMAKVLYAQHYARLVFDRELHDTLLKEVLIEDSAAEGFTLINVLAKERAAQLLNSAGDYFD
ncbi:MAG: hypothetical protein A2V90_07220 [Gammaproteobacteria bacterium RBG_16_57_12]|nr:MAG: hypothetical protein A2V90_07220 [Gammaproteobacteria bacterium RBG_16_57_12]